MALSPREILTKLKLNTISTTKWHLGKLEDKGLIQKNENGQYELTDIGTQIKKISIVLNMDMRFLFGRIFPQLVFSLSFMIFTIILFTIFSFQTSNPVLLRLYGLLAMIIALMILMFQYFQLRSKIFNYIDEK